MILKDGLSHGLFTSVRKIEFFSNTFNFYCLSFINLENILKTFLKNYFRATN